MKLIWDFYEYLSFYDYWDNWRQLSIFSINFESFWLKKCKQFKWFNWFITLPKCIWTAGFYFTFLEKAIMEFETFFHISIYQSSLSQVYTCISAKIAEKRSLFIFSSIVCWQLLMTPRHFLVYRVSWPLHSFFIAIKKLSLELRLRETWEMKDLHIVVLDHF